MNIRKPIILVILGITAILLYSTLFFAGTAPEKYSDIPSPDDIWWFHVADPSPELFEIANSPRNGSLEPGQDLKVMYTKSNPDSTWVRVETYGDLPEQTTFRFIIEGHDIELSGDNAVGDIDIYNAYSFINGAEIEFKTSHLSDDFKYSKLDTILIQNGIPRDSFRGDTHGKLDG